MVCQRTGTDLALENYIGKTVIDTDILGIVDQAPYYWNHLPGKMSYDNDSHTPPTGQGLLIRTARK